MALERKDVDKKYKWDLSVIYKDEAAFFEDYAKAEKMIKAKLILMGKDVEFTHNLVRLLDDFEDSSEIEIAREYGLILTNYESRSRYPRGKTIIYSPEDAEEAYHMALEMPYLIGLYLR